MATSEPRVKDATPEELEQWAETLIEEVVAEDVKNPAAVVQFNLLLAIAYLELAQSKRRRQTAVG